MAAANTYCGNTLISGGTLALGNTWALQNSTLDTSGSGSLNFGSLTSATFGGLTGPGTLSLANTASAALALSVGNNNASTTYSGMLNGAGSLTKVGTGTLLFSGSSTYTGTTTINSGVLAAGAVNTLSGSSGMAISGGTLDASDYAIVVKSLNMTSSGCLNLGPANLLTVSGTATFGGILNVGGTAGGLFIDLMNYASETGTFATSHIPSGYTLQYNATQLDLIQSASVTWAAATSGSWAAAANWTPAGVPNARGAGGDECPNHYCPHHYAGRPANRGEFVAGQPGEQHSGLHAEPRFRWHADLGQFGQRGHDHGY